MLAQECCARLGFEPRYPVPKTEVLPLDDLANKIIIQKTIKRYSLLPMIFKIASSIGVYFKYALFICV